MRKTNTKDLKQQSNILKQNRKDNKTMKKNFQYDFVNKAIQKHAQLL